MPLNDGCPEWAINIYGAYLWGWLNDSCLVDGNFRANPRHSFGVLSPAMTTLSSIWQILKI
ncbi:hypothetical protein BGW36DRAFT_387664 [Talaromyces proteolyticus]|uniref:Uncharacterized protein n=1 Tax=Talaromyces proteolyticus TaxID=1131652 RepID=A0AAD4KFE4_9EURO|nr:uncharacterized protein BGW36DRAFT_387664 [Talaromyces proteolyticus]KAH8691093.1 hypothetical protein BGW36DRAFT_387664 [Talaromyces proteolyticus]